MLASSMVSGNVPQITNPIPSEVAVVEEVAEVAPLTTEEQVHEYFKDIPILAEVAFCESRYRQFDSNGNVLRGVQNPADVGVMQINEKYHAATALKLGFNLYTLEGNMAYGRYLYEHEGTRPWKYSSGCWGDDAREVAIR